MGFGPSRDERERVARCPGSPPSRRPNEVRGWRRGWDSNPPGRFTFCKLQILQCRDCRKCQRCRDALHAIARAVAAPTALGLASKYDVDLANGVFCWARSARAAWSLSVASVRDHQGLALDQCGLGDREVRATAVSTLCRPRSIPLSPLAVCNVHSNWIQSIDLSPSACAPASSWMP